MYLINIIDTTGEPDIITQIIDGVYPKTTTQCESPSKTTPHEQASLPNSQTEN